jgi:uroporphyrinogen decarboxylase
VNCSSLLFTPHLQIHLLSSFLFEVTGLTSKPLIDVLTKQPTARRPIWFMRQAGRYLPEYRKLREQAGSFLGLCFNPELAAEVTLQPLRRYDLDAAIIFSDILIVPHAMGLPLAFVEGEGPVLEPVRSSADVARLKAKPDQAILGSIANNLARTKVDLSPHVALIGFSGAPWTVATYMVEGKSSDRAGVSAIAKERPDWFLALIDRLVETTIDYLSQQVDAGAEVLQIFDSWAGSLEGSMLDDYSIEPIRRIVAALRALHPNIPIIVFARGAAMRHADVLRLTGAAAVSVEQSVKLKDLLESMPAGAIVQGNLDPHALQASPEALEAQVAEVLDGVPRQRHIFNLGHGVEQGTDPEMVARAISAVRRHDDG